MIKRLLEVGIHFNRVWLLIKHNFPMYTRLFWISFWKNFLLALLFSWWTISWCPCWPKNNVRTNVSWWCHGASRCLKTMSQSKRKYYFSCALFSIFIWSILHLAAGPEEKESKVEKGNRAMPKQWKVKTVSPHDNKRCHLLIPWVGIPGLLFTVEYRKDILFPWSLAFRILDTHIQLQ